MKNKKDFIDWLAGVGLVASFIIGGWLGVGLCVISLYWLVVKQ